MRNKRPPKIRVKKKRQAVAVYVFLLGFVFFAVAGVRFYQLVGDVAVSPAVFVEQPTESVAEDAPAAQTFIDFSALLPKVTLPEKSEIPEGMVAVYDKDLSSSTSSDFSGVRVKNSTSLSDNQVAEILQQRSKLKVEFNSDEPQVLIMHTHCTESYLDYAVGYYDPATATRNTDNNQNTARVGQEIAAVLNANGICTLQDTTQHDYPNYNGAYDRSRDTVLGYLNKYKSIKIVLDVHRDAIIYSDNTWGKPVCTIGSQTSAQIMIIVGCNSSDTPIPNYADNLRFAAGLQQKADQMYAGLMRPILFRYSFYNQDLTTGSILLEMGSQANTLSDAVQAGRFIGSALVEYLKEQ